MQKAQSVSWRPLLWPRSLLAACRRILGHSTALPSSAPTQAASRAMPLNTGIRSRLSSEREWEAKNSPYRWPLHGAVYRRYERPDYEGYMERVAPTRVDYPAYNERRIECARAAARW
jgi:hypothetical protein